MIENNVSFGNDEAALLLDCKRSKGNHYVITFCQKMSLNDIYNHNDPGYMAPHNIPHVKFTLDQIAQGYAGSSTNNVVKKILEKQDN
jgi:hypothetical protein